MASADDIAALLMAQPRERPEPMGALAMAQAARASLATQPERLARVQPTWTPEAAAADDAAAMSPETYVNPAMGSLAAYLLPTLRR